MATWLAGVVGRVLGVFIENGNGRTDGDAPDAPNTPDARELRWLARARQVRLRSASPDWRNPNDTRAMDEHLRQDIGLRDTRTVRPRLPWD